MPAYTQFRLRRPPLRRDPPQHRLSIQGFSTRRVKGNGHHPKLRAAKRVVVAVVGGTVTLVGIALIVLPGPALVVIPVGLSILATEFVWARRYVRKARQVAARVKAKARAAA